MDFIVIRALIDTDTEFLQDCIVKIYERQTDVEQASLTAVEDNGVGFNKPDSFVMSKYAQIIMKGETMTMSEVFDARRRMTKYVTQLTKLLPDEED